MPLTPEAKKRLAETIRGTQQAPDKGVRARLLGAIRNEADRRYRLSVPLGEAGLDEAHRKRRERIESWIDERARAAKPKNKTELAAIRERLLRQAEKEAAATLLNRLILLRHLEALGLSKPLVVTGGWNSRGYREFREFAPTLCTNGTTDATEGYQTLLQLLFDELAVDLPGLFGDVGLTRLFPVPAATLREIVERLDEIDLASAWADDTTLGWVYQYWNDPDREALDAKINGGGKIEPHEIASKTQMFTERYMVEWLLQNSLGLTWLAMCRKKGWTAEAEAAFPGLEARREEWRRKRDANEVALDALMPIETDVEERWKYYVPQAIPEDAVANAPESLRAIRLLDPACGSGHFLVIAFDLLAGMYREEAKHLGASISDRQIAESILENNLHGIDIDPRAIQIAAAAVYLKAKALSKDARPRRVNLVAPVLQLGNLPETDPAVVQLRAELKNEVGIPEDLTQRLLASLAGVDYLGSLLKVDAAVDDALRKVELEFERTRGQGDLFGGFPSEQVKLSLGEARGAVLDRLERFLAKHSKAEDLGLRLDGEQLASGVRFVRIAKEGAYDVVVGNPPYQAVSKTDSFGYVAKTYPKGKADLYAAFLERGLQYARPGGSAAMVVMRGWMFLNQFRELREALLRENHLRAILDLDSGAFEEVSAAQVVLSVACSIFLRSRPDRSATALRPTPTDDRASTGMTNRKRAGLLAQVGRYEFDPRGFEVIDGEPIVYWWSKEFLAKYSAAPKQGTAAPARKGLCTGDDGRFTRLWWEPLLPRVQRLRFGTAGMAAAEKWVPTVKGGKGRRWIEPLVDLMEYEHAGLHVRTFDQVSSGAAIRNPSFYFSPGVAFTMIGSTFSARAHRYRSVFGNKGSSVFPGDIPSATCLLNSASARFVLESLNPGIGFEVGDVNRLPVLPIASAQAIFAQTESAFCAHESGRETSAEFRRPSPSPWTYAQTWAQRAVDRPKGAPIPAYEPTYDQPTATSFVSFAVGMALGRFGANGEGILNAAPASALPAGVLFLSAEGGDSLDHPACARLIDAWKEHGATVGDGDDLRTYLRKSFFDFHKKLYESRPIYFPLSSARKSFVAYVSIHRWADDALTVLLADHLVPTKRRLEGELADVDKARKEAGAKTKAERRFTDLQKLLEELNDFITKLTEIAGNGPPPPDDKTPKREVSARFAMDLDDGVMVNSAALWPLLEPQWKDPKKWWKELATAQGKKDYDWSRLAARYFPTRVRKKCHEDPSLAVAHKCFWALHPAKAYAWELRLQDEIRPDFTIDEPTSNEARAEFLADREREASDIRANEAKRRERKAAKADEDADAPLFEGTDDEDAEESDG